MIKNAAQLTLHIARFLQSPAANRRSPSRWRLLPDLTDRTFDEACAALAELPKPVLAAPLAIPGSVYVTPVSSLIGDVARTWNWHYNSQVTNFEPFTTSKGIGPEDVISLGVGEDVVKLDLGVLRIWTSEYLSPAQITVARDRADRGQHWLIVRHGDGHWSDGGWCDVSTST